MDKKTNKIIKELRKLKKHYKAKLMILFGSRARGDAFKESDVDVLIVSDAFKEMPFIQRMVDVQKQWNNDLLLEAFCYTPEEFERYKKWNGLIQKALKEGIRI